MQKAALLVDKKYAKLANNARAKTPTANLYVRHDQATTLSKSMRHNWKRSLNKDEVEMQTFEIPESIHTNSINLKIPVKSYRPLENLYADQDVVPKYEQLTQDDIHPDLPTNLIPSLRSKQPKKGWYVAYHGATIRPLGSEVLVEANKVVKSYAKKAKIDLRLRKQKYVYVQPAKLNQHLLEEHKQRIPGGKVYANTEADKLIIQRRLDRLKQQLKDNGDNIQSQHLENNMITIRPKARFNNIHNKQLGNFIQTGLLNPLVAKPRGSMMKSQSAACLWKPVPDISTCLESCSQLKGSQMEGVPFYQNHVYNYKFVNRKTDCSMIMTKTGKVRAIALPETPAAADETAACSPVGNEDDNVEIVDKE